MSEQHEHQSLLDKAWQVAEEFYGTNNADAERHMNNAHPASFGTLDTEDQFMTGVELIKRDGQAGFKRVTQSIARSPAVA